MLPPSLFGRDLCVPSPSFVWGEGASLIMKMPSSTPLGVVVFRSYAIHRRAKMKWPQDIDVIDVSPWHFVVIHFWSSSSADDDEILVVLPGLPHNHLILLREGEIGIACCLLSFSFFRRK